MRQDTLSSSSHTHDTSYGDAPPARAAAPETYPIHPAHGLEPLTRALLDSRTPVEVVDAVVERSMAVLGARAGLVALVSEDGQYLQLMRSSGYPDSVLAGWDHFPISATLPLSDAVRENKVLLLADRADWLARYPELPPHVPSGHFQGAASLPLSARGKVFGGLHFTFQTERHFDATDIEYLTELARLCALALDRALLLESAEGALKEAEIARDEAQAAGRRLEFLARAGSLLGESLDYRTRLESLARLCVPDLCDWAGVDVVDEAGNLVRLAVAHRNPELEPVMREAQQKYPPRRDGGQNALTVIETGEPMYYPQITAEMIDASQLEEEHKRLIKLVGISGILCIPIRCRDNILGALTVGMAPLPEGSGRSLTQEIRSLTEELARRAGAAVDNALLYELAQRESVEREIALQASEAAHRRTEAILESIGDMFYALDSQYRFTYVNRRALDLWGMTADELLGRAAWEVFPKAIGTPMHSAVVSAMEHRRSVTVETTSMSHPNWIELNVYPADDGGVLVYFRDIEDRKRAEQELRTVAEHEALLNRIAQDVRTAAHPEAAQHTAVTLLGEKVNADRCFYIAYDPTADRVHCYHDYHKPHLASVARDYKLSVFRQELDLLFAGGTAVVEDARNELSRIVDTFGIRSMIAVPLMAGDRTVAALFAGRASAHRWAHEEISLVEQVATTTRTAIDTARIAQREHAIAERLQEALQPEVPESVPGLDLAKHYRPALDEAQVGGDFADVFPNDNGSTFLVVGDLAGKGLAAASQVATIRNILRYVLYTSGSLVEAVENANRTVAQHEMLAGFATLFVACYNAERRTLTYVNCGQEAGVIVRAVDGSIEWLAPTGPVLGMSTPAAYAQSIVSFSPGDVFATFTDGLTEIGTSRSKLLGSDGVADLIARHATQRNAEMILSRVVADVDEFAHNAIRDDQCLLLGIVTE